MQRTACSFCGSFGHAQGFHALVSSWGALCLKLQSERGTWICGPIGQLPWASFSFYEQILKFRTRELLLI